LDELLAAFSDSDFDFSGQASILRLDRTSGGLELLLELRAFSGEFQRQAWILTCAEERHSMLRSEPFYGLELTFDHVLLSPYRDAQVELGIKGRATDPKAAVAELWQAHRSVAADWFPFDAFFNRGMPLTELLASSAAIVADGPSRIIQTYAQALQPYVAEAYHIRERMPQRWGERGWEPEDPDVQLLLFEPRDYVVGKGFAARRGSSDLLPRVA